MRGASRIYSVSSFQGVVSDIMMMCRVQCDLEQYYDNNGLVRMAQSTEYTTMSALVVAT